MMSSQGAAAGPSGIQKKCLYCKEPKPNLDYILRNAIMAELKYICDHCEERERFTVAKLVEKIGNVDFTSQNELFRIMFNIREGIDVSNVILGYLELEKCGVCHMEIPRNCSAEQHNTDNHPPNTIEKCTIGCEKPIIVENQPDDIAKPSGTQKKR
ncbi:Hypothetical predicted protein [Cloeon dipterum]|uniref:Uncharacterized protein n=1 Tax=Cloeon dipterum TaxID=197152 RepID=A0A8S1DEW7_9INSE|nr:Hypothetical predicted protein [Cloeon dipterum]